MQFPLPLCAAYAVFLAVTLPLVVIILAWVLGLLIYTLRTHTAVQRDAVASVAFQPKRYKAFRYSLAGWPPACCLGSL